MIHSQNEDLKKNFVWRKNWISPYESTWSILEKFKYANCATIKDIIHLFGTDIVKNLKSSTIGRTYRDCIHLTGLDDDLLEPVFSQPLIKMNTQNVNRLFGILPNRPRYSYFRNELFFCLECIKSGFHSLFHQFKLLHECPYHQISLHKGCPRCNHSIPFELTDKFTKKPFQCLCGHSFLDDRKEDSYLPTWKQILLDDLKSKETITWINLDEHQISRLKNFYFPLSLQIEECTGFLDYVLSLLDQEYPAKSKEIHNVVKSTPYIHQLIGDKEKEERKSNYVLKRIKFYDALYISSVQTVQSIASHARKTILKEHRACIQRLFKSRRTGEPICPYALAYAHWMKFILGYESIWMIRRATPYRKYAERIGFGSKQDDSYLSDLFHDWRCNVEDFTEESRSSIKWIFNRVIGHLIWNHFMNWLSISQDASEGRIEYRRVPFGLKNLPFYILVIPNNKKDPIEFHWWSQPRKNHIILDCPCSSKKQVSDINMPQ